ncbi:MAG: cell division protein FtsA, partial [Minisyncoccales bacterium]
MRSIFLTAIDIGSGSLKGMTAGKNLQTGEIDILATEQISCYGIRNGEIIDAEQTAKGLEKLKEALEESAAAKIKEVIVNIGGPHLVSLHSRGVVSVSRADKIVSKEDLHRVLKESETVNLKNNQEVLEIFPKEFSIDDEGDIKNPVGLKGSRLEVKSLLACIFSPALDNLEKAMSLAGLDPIEIFITPLALAEILLSEEQKEGGVVVVDIGFSTTSLAVFEKSQLIDFFIFPLGSSHITNDLAIGLRIDIQTAEFLKKEFGTLKVYKKSGGKNKKREGDRIKLPEKDLTFSKKFLKKVIEARVNEILSEIQKNLKKIVGPNQLPYGVVFTGGGS